MDLQITLTIGTNTTCETYLYKLMDFQVLRV